MTQIQDFKDNAYQGTWDHAKKIFKPMLIVGLVSTGLFYLIAFISSKLFFPGFIEEYVELTTNPDANPSETGQELVLLVQSYLESGVAIPIIILLFVVLMVFSSWILNFRLLISQDSILDRNDGIIEVLKASFNKKVFNILLGYLLVGFIFGICGFVAMLIVGAVKSVGLIFLAMTVIFIFALRLIGMAAAIVHGDMPVWEAVNFSWTNVTFKRALIMFLIFLGGGILLAIVSGLLSILLGGLGMAGVILNFAFSFLLGVFMNAMFTSIQSGVFFRYADVEIEGALSSPEDHLVE